VSGRPLALVTGASAGIGRELARILAREGHDLVLVARREPELHAVADELRSRFGAASMVVAADLSAPDAGAQIADAIGPDRRVDVLVNNAGFGGVGSFATRDRDADLRMLAVNVVALTDLSKRFLPGMLARGHGRILNVASTAAFQPGPFMAVYYASKAYVLSLSQALAEEADGSGVTVTCLCPGVTESEFHAVAGTDAQPLTSGPLTMSSEAVAEAGYRAMVRGKLVEIPGLHNKVGAQSIRVAPRRLVLKIVRRLHPGEH
jgi:short-subunit dehydrogenase